MQHLCTVKLGNSKTAIIGGKGITNLLIRVNEMRTKCELLHTLHGSVFGYQHLSATTFDKSGIKTSFHLRRCQIEKVNTLIASGHMTGNLYRLDTLDVPKELVARDLDIRHK